MSEVIAPVVVQKARTKPTAAIAQPPLSFWLRRVRLSSRSAVASDGATVPTLSIRD
jgi:hypothetical protein